jgi:hypothetical protein
MKLHFDKKEMETMLEKANKEVMIVGDRGVYIMADTHDHKKAPAICYAQGCDPEKDEGWWELKRATFGGDDGSETLTKDEVLRIVKTSRKSMTVSLTPTSLTMESN